jgi:hypothetical protein
MEDFRLTKVAGEGNMLRVRHVLIGENQHQMFHPDIVKCAKHGGVKRPAHVDATHLGAECRVQLAHRQRRGCGLRAR